MNNILVSIKRFFKNKNTVTILGVIVILGALYWGYSSQIKAAVNEVSMPIAASTIQPRTEIIASMVGEAKVPAIVVSENAFDDANQVIGKYSAVNSVIPAGSLFYREVLVDKKDLPDSAFIEVKEGEIPYMFPVDLESTFGNSIFPGNKIDIYMKAEDSTGKVMVGKLIADVEVLAVKDSNGRNVFENTEEDRTPAYLIFGLPEEIHILLRKARYMTSQSVELFPVPHGGVIASEGETRVSTEYLKNFINANSVMLEGQDGTKPSTGDKENTDNTNTGSEE